MRKELESKRQKIKNLRGKIALNLFQSEKLQKTECEVQSETKESDCSESENDIKVLRKDKKLGLRRY